MKTPDILLTAIRQYNHNDRSGLLFGFDHDETVKIVASLNKKIDELQDADVLVKQLDYDK